MNLTIDLQNLQLLKIADRTPRVDRHGKHWYWNAATKRWRRDYDKDPKSAKKVRPKDSAAELKPKQDLSIDDLAASDRMLAESKRVFGIEDSEIDASGDISLEDLEGSDREPPKPKQSTHPELRPKNSEPELKPKGAKNEIKPARLSDRRQLLNQIKGWETDLSRLGEAANEAIAQNNLKEGLEQMMGEIDSILDEYKGVMERIHDGQREKLERIYKGRLDRFDAVLASSYKRIFEALNPSKQIKVPKGTTQREYLEIVKKISGGDRKAIAQYTTKKPKKSAAKLKPKGKKK